MFEFEVVPGTVVAAILKTNRGQVLDLVRNAYLWHERKQTINPDSYFLRFPDKPEARIIALPAYVGGTVDKAGIKWISSFPRNINQGVPRASAVLLLNDYATGHPVACLEAAGISAARTAASAVVATAALTNHVSRISLVGAGVIARTVLDYLLETGFRPTHLDVYDLESRSAEHLARHARIHVDHVSVVPTIDDALRGDVVVFATTAASPYVGAATPLRAGQILLNISLRDLAPELLLDANNIVDDVEHCLKAQTSPHLAEQLSGGRDFITGTIGGLLLGQVTLDQDRPLIISPFGLGVLDIAVGHYVLEQARGQGQAIVIPDFFGETTRW
ncbi:2,3-diaminopropionate biosynthesis protein SbnB [Nonomuraea sp. NPDC050643]|uniref:2,3-diaminopropionate biosynthesis protein SbnB n=1 Tax=Nonomuraea sp. NPDC050643 TaxID=3155660 RepID=UPI0033FFB485